MAVDRPAREIDKIEIMGEMVEAGAAVLRCHLADLSEGWSQSLARGVLEAAFGTPIDESYVNY
jgi:hypothetical protein